MMGTNRFTILILTLLLCNFSHGFLTDLFADVASYFTRKENADDTRLLTQSVPYEVSESDEEFIREAAKLTGVSLSELDSCQQRVVLKLQTTCHKMNDEQLAKMAVMLLNCQSAVEGRKIFPCTDAMSIKQCTSSMDADTWNSYHLISNRARAVCYSVRQMQFRGLTEDSINRLMSSAKSQLQALNRINKDQEHLHMMAQGALDAISKGQESVMTQQKDLEKAHFFSQLSIEDNIKRLADEKRLISESYADLIALSKSIQTKLEDASDQMKEHYGENKENHNQLLVDLIAVQEGTKQIFQRIEQSSKLLQEQNAITQQHYESTILQLAQLNKTVHFIVNLIDGTRVVLEERLNWLTATLGGTDITVERVCMILWHIAFVLIGMLGCAFLNAHLSTRLFVISLTPLNLVLSLQNSEYALNPFDLLNFLAFLALCQMGLRYCQSLWHTNLPRRVLPWVKQKLTPTKETVEVSRTIPSRNEMEKPNLHQSYQYKSDFNAEELENETHDSFNLQFASPTPPPSRSGYSCTRSRSRTPLLPGASSKCHARTKLGTPCKLTAVPGRHYCNRHQNGDSVYAL